jgi:hypothetical protein
MEPRLQVLVRTEESPFCWDQVAILWHELEALAVLRTMSWGDRSAELDRHLLGIRRINERRARQGLKPIL